MKQPVLLWKKVLKRFTGHVKPKYLKRLMNQCNEPDALKLSKAEVEKKLWEAELKFDAACARAAPMRKAHLEGLAKALAEKNNTTEEAELKKLNQTAKQKKKSRRLRRAAKKPSKGLAVKLSETVDGEIRYIEDQPGLVRASKEENLTRFTRCQNCSFLHGQLLADIGLLADGPAVPDILMGTYNPPDGTGMYEAMLLEGCRIPQVLLDNPVPAFKVTKEGHQQSWKRQREHTAGEPSSLDFSQHIAASSDPFLADMDAELRSIPLEDGFSPPLWEKFTDCSIPKKAADIRVSKMRTICLMDPAYNMNNKAYGRHLMFHNEQHGTLADEQSGSRKGRRAPELTLQKKLTGDQQRQSRRSGFLCSNDALQCYDRIVHNVAMLCMMSKGGDFNPLKSLFATLQNGVHTIMTGYGLSEETYGGKAHMDEGNLPIQGVLQGNGMGPFIWAMVSSVLLQCMATAGHVAKLAGALSGKVLSFVGYAFVDDTDICFTADNNHQSAQSLLPSFQDAVNCWAGLLNATGGGLEHLENKTFWYLIDFKWTGDKWEYHSARDTPGEISIQVTDSDERATLCRKEPHEGSKTLGIVLAMDGNERGEIELLEEKVEKWVDAYRTAKGLEKNDAWEALNTTILSTLKYPAAATTITEEEWNSIMKPVIDLGLQKSGISRSFPRDVLFGPERCQGMGLIHPFHYQELEHLETILRTGNAHTTTGEHIERSLEWLKLELGMPGPVWELDYSLMSDCATDCWIKTVWKYCWEHHISLSDPTPELPLQREGDKHIMQAFVQSQKFSAKELRKLNVCRCYLRATTLSDICTADGKKITNDALEGIQGPLANDAPEWPRQPPFLRAEYWALWKRALNLCFIRNTTVSSLWLPLGRWHKDPSLTAHWLFDPISKEMYEREGQHWRIYTNARGTARVGTFFKRTASMLEALPPGGDLRGATASTHPNRPGEVRLTSFSNHQPSPPGTTEADLTLAETFESLPPHTKWAVENLQFGSDEGLQVGGNVAAAILRGDARAVSDGSYKEGHGTSAFTLQGDTPTKAIKGQNTIPGCPEEQSAFRSELGGVVGVLTVLETLCSHFDLTEGKIELGLDGESVIKKLERPYLPSPKDPHYDMLLDCKLRLKALPIEVKLRWIEGHQDDKGKPMGRLDWWALQNIRMDAAAKRHAKRTAGSTPPNFRFANEAWSVWIRGRKLSSFTKQAVYELVNDKKAKDYWMKKESNPLTEEQWDSFNKPALKTAKKERPTGKNRFIFKFATGHFACGRQMKRRKEWNHDRCPVCGAPDENNHHVLMCQAVSSRATWTKALQDLKKWMTDADTQPDIQKHILDLLEAWVDDRPQPRLPLTSLENRRALQAQNDIGAWNMILGRISTQLEVRQGRHYKSIKSRRSGRRWTVELIKKMQDVAWDMWDHRNSVLHGDPTRHHQKTELEDANDEIEREWTRGPAGLLAQDLFLFRSRSTVDNWNLEEKREWLASVQGARDAAEEASAAARRSYEHERRGMTHFLNGLDARGRPLTSGERPQQRRRT